MHIIGVIEMIVGLAILTKWTRVGAYVASIWLLVIAANLVSTGMFFDVAVRDVEMSVAAFVLGRLSEARSNEVAVERSKSLELAANRRLAATARRYPKSIAGKVAEETSPPACDSESSAVTAAHLEVTFVLALW